MAAAAMVTSFDPIVMKLHMNYPWNYALKFKNYQKLAKNLLNINDYHGNHGNH
jgi:hypothetical protein